MGGDKVDAMAPRGDGSRAPWWWRISPVEWTLLTAFALGMAVLWPFADLGGKGSRQAAAGYHCSTCYRAEQKHHARLVDGRPTPYATPRELAGAVPFIDGSRLAVLDASWETLDREGTAETGFGYRAAFFLAPDRACWSLVLWPQRWGVDGDVMYAITQDGDMHACEPPAGAGPTTRQAAAVAAWGSVAAASSPANATWAPGWHPVD